MILESVYEYEWLESFRRGYNKDMQQEISKAVERYKQYVKFESEKELAIVKNIDFYCIIKCCNFNKKEFINLVQPFMIIKNKIYTTQLSTLTPYRVYDE